ncbi:hypothetical protein PINS_up012235 [Pythium insidiosum]|nr:hypothetical protein PINS_up012235 [Pythium insidiosum]
MSIEETNKLRAALGLKPLSVGPKKAANVVDLKKSRAQVEEEAEREAIKKALAASKKKRELTQRMAGQSIGEQLKAAAPSSALDWVKQSRTATVKATAQSNTTAKDTGDSYDASALAGMTVGHDVTAFEEGTEVVLTLKDARVLTDDGNDVNADADDELVNVEMSEQDRRAAQQKRALRAKMPVYSGYDEDEFIVVGAKRSRRKDNKLLAQYDEDDDEKQAEQARKFVLGADGSAAGVTEAGVEDEAKDVAEDRDADVVVSLAMDKQKAMADYYTKDEMDAMFTKKLRKKRKEKKKRKHTAAADDADDGDGENVAKLMEELEAAAGDGSKDRGKRRRTRHQDDHNEDHAMAEEEEENLRRFQEAREKANAVASNALAASKTAPATKKKRRVAAWDGEDVMEDALDLELSATLARTRQLAQIQSRSSSMTAAAPSSEDKIAALVSQTVGIKQEDDGPNDASATISSTDAASTGVVFNDATDFETRLRNAMEQRASLFQAPSTSDTNPTVAVSVKAEAKMEDDDMDIDEGDETKTEEMRGEEVNAKDDDDDEASEQGWGADQPLVGVGMGATLALLRRTGELRETRAERQAGRVNDARDRNVEEELLIKDGVKLDYRDEFGRLLTKKEAFRLMSYKFHGHKPGKKKQEKRLRQVREELAAQKALSGEGSTKMMKALEKKQQQAKQAFVVLSGGS